MEITSINNQIVKEIVKLQQKKYRNSTGKFLLEGYKTIKEAYDFGIDIELVFVENSHLDEYAFLGEKIVITNENVLKKIATTDSAPNAIAVGYQKFYDKTVFKSMQKVVLLENIKDLGNLGTIIRTSVAFGVEGIVLYGDSADLYNPKCVRASVGNLWKVPIINVKDFSTLSNLFVDYQRIATLPKSNNLLKNFKTELPVLVMFGSEADGLSDELIEYSTDNVKIEMNKNVESLNLAVSAGVVIYKMFI